MRRSSILGLMAVVAILAADFTVARVFYLQRDAVKPMLLVVLLPLANAVLVGLHFLVTNYRLAVRRRAGRARFAPAFALASSLTLLVGVCICLGFTYETLDLVDSARAVVDRHLPPVSQEFAAGLELALIRTVSVPPLLSLAVAAVMSRFQLVVTPRELPCDTSPSSP